ncbi:hypothetical protein POVCU1_073960 [Plasmodium ovale curtisi]|uniref:Uncharacterized protein n=1 Tax=Plasmodium ovale curtisi TaxID=864141 RepID=A0A1A8XAA1_PLAOA|nr:hypothetical protein POVCU1_073960 [Plasmodium ovale curtisi]
MCAGVNILVTFIRDGWLLNILPLQYIAPHRIASHCNPLIPRALGTFLHYSKYIQKRCTHGLFRFCKKQQKKSANLHIILKKGNRAPFTITEQKQRVANTMGRKNKINNGSIYFA